MDSRKRMGKDKNGVIFPVAPNLSGMSDSCLLYTSVVDLLSDEYGWSDSVSNLSAKLQRESIRYKEVLELAAVLGYDIVWQKRREK